MSQLETRSIELGGGRYAPTAARVALDAWPPLSTLAEYRDVRLLVSEVVAYSVLRSPSVDAGFELVVSLSRHAVRVELRGAGASLGWDPLAEEEHRASGWRLFLIGALAQRWGMDQTGDACVWFEVERQPSGDSAG